MPVIPDVDPAVPDELSLGRRLLDTRTVVSFLIAIAILVFVFTRLNINVSAIWDEIRGANPLIFALAFATYYLGFPLRAYRWRLLLHNVDIGGAAGERLPAIPRLSEILVLGWFANCVVPAKLGDAYRAYLLKQDAGVSFARTFGTIVAERVIDLLVLFALLVLSALWILRRMTAEHANTTSSILEMGAVLVVLLVVGLIGLRLLGSRIDRFLPRRVSDLWSRLQAGVLGSFRPKQLPVVTLLTILIWMTEAGRLYFVTQSVGIETEIGLAVIVFAALANSLLTAVPATPGGLGVVEAGVIGIFSLVNVPEQTAAAITLLDRTISYWSLIVVGMVFYALTFRRR